MANVDSVAQNTAANFGSYAVASATAVPLGATGNAVVALPILSGGLTQGGSLTSSGQVILRRITVQNPSGSVATANVSILTSNDGNVSNAVVAATVLSTLTGSNTFQDLTIASPYAAANTINGYTTQALFVKVNTAVANATVDIRVYGDTVSF
jgi:hypothetical protein